jgi:hypothetical protein
VTLSLLTTLLSAFETVSVDSPERTLKKLSKATKIEAEFDFILLDHFEQAQLHGIARLLDENPIFANTKAIHLYTPTPLFTSQAGGSLHQSALARAIPVTDDNIDMALASATGVASTHLRDENSPITSFGRVVRMNKPPRRARLLQLLANLKDIPAPAGGLTNSQIEQALESLGAAQALLNTANVLIAEGWSILEGGRSEADQADRQPCC